MSKCNKLFSDNLKLKKPVGQKIPFLLKGISSNFFFFTLRKGKNYFFKQLTAD